jgi:protein-tyrosine phosphatase
MPANPSSRVRDVIDLHSHILAGLDDGPREWEESLELARRAVSMGVTAMAATPHVREDYPTTADAMESGVAELRARLEESDISLRVLPGGEVAVEELDRRSPDELRRFGLGGNPAYLLVETPYFGLPLDFENRLFRLRALGITPVLAHPERNSDLGDDRALLGRIVFAGALLQVTADSLAGGAGRRAKDTAHGLVDSGLAQCVASDSHGPQLERAGLEAVSAEVGDPALAEWLTRGVPEAIVAGEPLPERPRPRPSWLSLRRSRRTV